MPLYLWPRGSAPPPWSYTCPKPVILCLRRRHRRASAALPPPCACPKVLRVHLHLCRDRISALPSCICPAALVVFVPLLWSRIRAVAVIVPAPSPWSCVCPAAVVMYLPRHPDRVSVRPPWSCA